MFRLLEEVGAYQTLLQREEELLRRNMGAEAASNRQVWQLIMDLLDQLHALLGDRRASMKDIARFVTSGLTGAENMTMFTSTATDNLARLVDKSVDTAIAAAKSGGRTELEALETALWEACPAIPVSFPCRYYGFAPDTADIVARPFGGGRYQSPLDFRSAKYYD